MPRVSRARLLVVVTLGLALIVGPALADFDIGRVEATGKTRDEVRGKAYSEAVTQGLVRYYGFQADSPLIARIIGGGLDRLKGMIAGVPAGPVGQRGGEMFASLVFRGNEIFFDREIKANVEQFLHAAGSKNVLTAFVVSSTKNVILDAQAEWLRARSDYTPEAAVRLGTERLSKAGDDVDRIVQATMARFGIPFRNTPREFTQSLLAANSDIANRAAGSEFLAIEHSLREHRADFDRALIGVIDVDSVTLKDGLYFVSATVSNAGFISSFSAWLCWGERWRWS